MSKVENQSIEVIEAKHVASFDLDSIDSNDKSNKEDQLPLPVLVYHESARSIVFRDDLRRKHQLVERTNSSNFKDSSSNYSHDSGSYHGELIKNHSPIIRPLPKLELGPQDEFSPLLESSKLDVNNVTHAKQERDILDRFESEQATVKTIKNSDWTFFLNRFWKEDKESKQHILTSFSTSTSLLPKQGKKMRCYGSTNEYTVGVVFGLPLRARRCKDCSSAYKNVPGKEDEVTEMTKTYTWPSGYSAKTEFNIDERGNLINGRNEARVSISQLRKYNHSYLHDKDHVLALGKVIKGGLNVVPYNEVYLKVGNDSTHNPDTSSLEKSYENGVGLPIGLFVRTAKYGDLVTLLRTRARLLSLLGKNGKGSSFGKLGSGFFVDENIPLLLLTPGGGATVLTSSLQTELLHRIASNLNPFQNTLLSYKTNVDRTDPEAMQQKMEELFDLDAHDIKNKLTPEERARIAGGFGATDDSVAALLLSAMEQDGTDASQEEKSGKLQDIVNEGLSNAVRAGDYHTSRQLLILYTLVAARASKASRERSLSMESGEVRSGYDSDNSADSLNLSRRSRQRVLAVEHDTIASIPSQRCVTPPMSEPKCQSLAPTSLHTTNSPKRRVVSSSNSNEITDLGRLAPPPPPPLDTERLRSATNSDGLLAVLGAAEVLKSMKNGDAERRVIEAISAMEEWVHNGEQSLTFRLASWRDQRVAQGDLKIAFENDSNMMAFISNKAVSNRRKFASQLRQAISNTDFQSFEFLQSIYKIVARMQHPCLRLELLQYILGLDNRYSVAHVSRSVELAATCLGLANSTYSSDNTDDEKEESIKIENGDH